MFVVEVYAAVRQFVFNDGKSRREAARVFGLSRETVSKMCRFSMPPGYVRQRPAAKPKLGPLIPVIEAILEADRIAPVKQRHTAKRIFERLRDEHGFAGGYTVVKDHVRIERARGRETFVPLAHPPCDAQVYFGEAVGVIGGVRQKIHFFCMDLPQSDACFVKGYPAETTEAFLDGHVSAFAFFSGVPLSILYDNLKIAVAKTRARFTNLIAEPDATAEAVTEAVNDTLKAIAASLLMEQVLAPRFEFKPKNPDNGPTPGFNYGEGGYDPAKCNVGVNEQTGLIQMEIRGLMEPKSHEAVRICREDLNELITAFV